MRNTQSYGKITLICCFFPITKALSGHYVLSLWHEIRYVSSAEASLAFIISV